MTPDSCFVILRSHTEIITSHMRTKTLLLTAALAAAGAATSMAQVYSVNMVGYINHPVPTGFSVIANHLNTPDNKVTSLLATAPEGTRIYKFNPTSGGFIFIQIVDGVWEGDDTSITLAPGEGAFIFSNTAFTQTFVGEVLVGNSAVPLPNGFSMVSSALPQGGRLDTPPPGGLNFPVAEGDRVYQIDPATLGFIFNQFVDGAWEGDSGGNPPMVGIGEAYYVFNNGLAKDWNRTFSVSGN